MKILDRDGRLFGKISIIDVIVLVVVAVLAATLYLKHQMPQTSGGVSTTAVVYQMRLENQPEYMLSAIQVGDQLYDLERSTNGALGTIQDIQVSEGTYMGALPDGTYGPIPAKGRYNLLLTLEGQALVGADGSISLNRIYNLGANSSRTFATQYATFIGTVMNIQIPGAEDAQ